MLPFHVYPPGHFVYQHGPYYDAFSELDDIDAHELAILLYLGRSTGKDPTKEPIDFPSVAMIAKKTKMNPTTARKKVKSLSKKGYLKTKARMCLSVNNKLQQLSHEYEFQEQSFEVFKDQQEFLQEFSEEIKVAVGQDFHGEPVGSSISDGDYEVEDQDSAVNVSPANPRKK